MNAKDTIKTIKNLPNQISVMLKGNHGIGKSQIVTQAAKEAMLPFCNRGTNLQPNPRRS